ncbi:hypothetical protein DOY81_002925, partial [Sarcophaga bullata]
TIEEKLFVIVFSFVLLGPQERNHCTKHTKKKYYICTEQNSENSCVLSSKQNKYKKIKVNKFKKYSAEDKLANLFPNFIFFFTNKQNFQ